MDCFESYGFMYLNFVMGVFLDLWDRIHSQMFDDV